MYYSCTCSYCYSNHCPVVLGYVGQKGPSDNATLVISGWSALDPSTPVSEIYRNLVKEAQLAEECGFHGVFAAEHHFTNFATISNSLTYIAALSQVTKRIRLGTMAVILPLNNPTRVAEEAAMIDYLSGGRFELGVARGFVPYEFEGLGVDISTSGALMKEALDIISRYRGSAEPISSTEGLPARTLSPQFAQPSGPPMWYACGTTSSIDSALERNMGAFKAVGIHGIEPAAEFAACYFERCEAFGVDPSERRLGAQIFANVGDSEAHLERALNQARHHNKLGRLLGTNVQIVNDGVVEMNVPDPSDWRTNEVITSGTLIGNEEHVVKVAAAYESLGYTDLSLNLDIGDVTSDERCETLRAVARALGLSG